MENVVDDSNLMGIEPKVAASLSVFCFDIEVLCKKYGKRKWEKAAYPIGVISCSQGDVKKTFLLTSPLVKDDGVNPEMEYFDNDRDLLMAFRAFFFLINPDFVRGYGKSYMLQRAKKLGLCWSSLRLEEEAENVAE